MTVTPLLVIPAIKRGAKRLFARLGAGSPALREKVLPATIAIAAIPVVVPPIDNATTLAFNLVREKPEPYHWSGPVWEPIMGGHAGDAHKGEMK